MFRSIGKVISSHWAESEKNVPENPGRKVHIGPIEIDKKTLLIGAGAALLFLIEWTKLIQLGVPLSMAELTFDSLANILSNASTIMVLVLASLLVLFLGLFVAFSLTTILLIITFCSAFLLSVGYRGLAFTMHKVLELKIFDSVPLRKRPEETNNPIIKLSRVTKNWLLRNSVQPAKNYNLALKKIKARRAALQQKLIHFLENTWATFWTWSASSPTDSRLRFGALIVFSLIAVGIHLETRHDLVAGMERRASPDWIAKNAPIVETRSGLPGWIDSSMDRLVAFFMPRFSLGTMVLSKSGSEATHLASIVPLSSQASGPIRTEEVFHLGNFGDWAYVARWRNPDERFLILRSSIIEFSRCDLVGKAPEKHVPPTSFYSLLPLGSAAATPREIVSCVGNVPKRTVPESELAAAQADISALKDDLKLTRSLVFRHLALGISERKQIHEVLNGLLLSDIAARVEYINARNRIGNLESLESKTTERTDLIESKVSDLKSSIENLPIINTTLESLGGFLTQLGVTLATHHTADGGARNSGSIFDSTQIDVSLRPADVRTDFVHRNGSAALASCIGPEHAPMYYVDFNIGQFTNGDSGAVERIVNHLQGLNLGGTGASRTVILQGGASDTGASAMNMRLSEKRAEWVKRQILKRFNIGEPFKLTEMERQLRDDHQIDMVAFGLGERIRGPQSPSARAVEVFICDVAEPDSTVEQTAQYASQ